MRIIGENKKRISNSELPACAEPACRSGRASVGRRTPNSERGFTLIELTVAIGIFSVVTIMIGSIFVSAFSGHRRILALQALQDNLRFTVEAMAREVRVGANFSSVGSQLSFTNAYNQAVVYRLNNNAIERSNDGGATFLPMTDPSVNINLLNFYLIGAPASDGLQPRVTFTIRAAAQVGTQGAQMDIQTTLSQRLLQS